MPTSSFDKFFLLKTKQEVSDFILLVNQPAKSVKIDRSLTNDTNRKIGIEKIKTLKLK